jgi:hypothetical protein
MAQVDPSIAMGYRPIQIESPINQMAAIAQLRGAQEASQMNALKMQEYQRGTQQRNALAAIHADPNVKIGSPEYLNRVQQEAPDLYESVAARAQQRAELEEKVEERKFKNFERKFGLFKSIVPNINSEGGVYQYIQAAYNDPDLKPILEKIQPLEAALESNANAFNSNPEEWRMRSSGVSAEKMAELALQKERARREEARLDLEGQRVEETQRHQKAMESISGTTAERQQKQLEETQRHNRAMEALSARRESTDRNKVANTVTDDQGNVTFYNAYGEKLRTELNAGKRSPTLIKQEQAEKNLSRDIDRTTKELAEITKDGGLIDQSTGSGAGRLVDVGARFVGQATEGDVAITKLKPIADMVLKMVPRFEGPQSDKDTQSYKEAAGQLADPSLPTTLRKEAGKTILRLMKERKDQFVGEGMDTSPNQRRAAPPPPSGFVPDKK